MRTMTRIRSLCLNLNYNIIPVRRKPCDIKSQGFPLFVSHNPCSVRQCITQPVQLLCSIAVRMLNYGAASQSYFGIEGTAANASLTVKDKALGEVSVPDTFKYDDNAALPEGVSFEGATLSLKSETTLSLYFKELPEDTVFTCEGKTVETAKNGDHVVARIRGIKANELENDFTVTFEGGSVTYNAMTYCCNVLNGGSDDEKLQDVVKALYKYAQAAKTYSE